MSPVASQNVEMKGVEKTAGSTRIDFATSGMTPPTVAEMVHTESKVRPMTVPVPTPMPTP